MYNIEFITEYILTIKYITKKTQNKKIKTNKKINQNFWKGEIFNMARKFFTDESLNTLVDETKAYVDDAVSTTYLVGTTANTTPAQVKEALQSGKSVILTHTDSTYGTITVANFGSFAAFDAVCASFIAQYDSIPVNMELLGAVSSGQWYLFVHALAQQSDIPTTLPNPNAITFTGAVTGTYDGSAAKTVNIPSYSAAGSSLGLVKSGGDVTISSGVISVNDDSHNHTIANVDNLQTTLDSKANTSNNPNLTYYATDNGSATEGAWLGTCSSVTSLFDGLSVNYKVTVAGASTTTFNLNGLGAKQIYLRGTTAMTTHFAVGTMLNLIYNATTDAWYCADYDANTKNSAGTSNKSATKMYLVGATSQTSSGTTTYTNSNVYIGTDNCLYSNGKKVTNEDEVMTLIELKVGVLENGTY